MNPYAEPGLLSEASLTSSSLCPEAAEPAEDVIDRCRPPGQPAGLERCILGSLRQSTVALGVEASEGSGVAVCPLSDLTWGVVEHSGAWWTLAESQDSQPQQADEQAMNVRNFVLMDAK